MGFKNLNIETCRDDSRRGLDWLLDLYTVIGRGSYFTTGGLPPFSSTWRQASYGRVPQGAWRQDELIGGKPPLVKYFFIASGVRLNPLYCGHSWPIVPAPDDRWGWLWINWWNEDWQGKPKYSEKTCPSATLSTTNPTWPDPINPISNLNRV
jgi:hypothetical protein